MVRFQNLTLTLIAGLLASSLGCTRGGQSNTTVTLALPDVHAHSTGSGLPTSATVTYHAIIVNVSGPGISAPIAYQWLNNDNGGTASTPPSTISLTVPSGDERLVQAMVLLDDSGTQQSSVFYGEQTLTLVDGANSVNITTGLEASALEANDQIAGRWLGPLGKGPTGRISVYYQPINGSPAMLIDDKSPIVAGWFKVFAFSGPAAFKGLIYKVADVSLFDYAVNLNNLTAGKDLGISAGSAMTVYTPTYCQKDGSSSFNCQNQISRYALGFFGPSASSTYSVCYPSAQTLSNIYMSDESTALQWVTSATTQDGYSYPITGGVLKPADSYGNCLNPSASGRYLSFLSFNPQNVGDSGSSVGFRGAFEIQPSTGGGGNYVTTTFTNPNLTLGYTLLPGVTDVVAGIDIFAKATSSDSDVQTDNSFACAQLSAAGYSYLGDAGTSGTASLPLSSSPSILGSLAAGSSPVAVIACPYASSAGGKVYLDAAVDTWLSGAPGRYLLTVPGQTWASGSGYITGPGYPIYAGQTNTVSIYPTDSNWNLNSGYVIPASTVLSSTVGAMSFSSILTNTTPWTANFTFSMAPTQPPIFVNQSTFANLGTLIPGLTNFTLYPNPSARDEVEVYNMPTASTMGCQPVLYQQGMHFTFNPTSQSTVGFSDYMPLNFLNQSSDILLFKDASCSTAFAAGDSFFDSSPFMVAYARATTGTGSGSLAPGFSNNSMPFIETPSTLTANTPINSVVSYKVLGPTSFVTDKCQEFVAVPVDAQGLSAAPTAGSFNVTIQVGGFSSSVLYADANCTTSTGAVYTTIAGGGATRAIPFFIKVPHNFAMSGTTGLASGGVNVMDNQATPVNVSLNINAVYYDSTK